MKQAARLITERAESYSRDARKFSDAAVMGQPILTAEDDARWASVYGIIADEMRKVAALVTEYERSAPAWNCVDHPGEGMHYVPGLVCLWCGKTREQIAPEYA